MTTQPWANRIIGHGVEAPDQLLANPRNWRIHPKAQQDALGGLLDKVGWVQDVIVNQRTGHVVDGHLRVSLALSRQEPTMPVVYVDLSPEEEALVLASLDPLAAMAVTDQEMLAALLVDVNAEGALLNMLSKTAGVTDSSATEWGGMPEFAQEEIGAWRRITVNFAGPEDYEAFQELVGTPVDERTRSMWYPGVKDSVFRNKRYVVEE